jgi:hypothetical protein
LIFLNETKGGEKQAMKVPKAVAITTPATTPQITTMEVVLEGHFGVSSRRALPEPSLSRRRVPLKKKRRKQMII